MLRPRVTPRGVPLASGTPVLALMFEQPPQPPLLLPDRIGELLVKRHSR